MNSDVVLALSRVFYLQHHEQVSTEFDGFVDCFCINSEKLFMEHQKASLEGNKDERENS